MKRIEIIFNQSLEEDIFASLQDIPEAQFFTLIPRVYGKGFSTPKMGDSVWPEENKLLIIYTSSEAAVEKIEKAIKALQKTFQNEGLAYFILG